MQFARWVFYGAGVYGVLAILPLYFMEGMIAREMPPAITHPEYFYGFVGVGLAWQVAFLVIGTDPARYRPLMIPAMIEKFSFAGAAAVLYLQGRLSGQLLGAAGIDFLLGLLFVAAFIRLRKSAS